MKRHSVYGDSISTFCGLTPVENVSYYDANDTNSTGVNTPDETWWMQAIKQDDGELLSNAAYSGSMVEGDGFPAGQSPQRTKQILGPNGEQPDIVWVFYGINDYGWGGYEAQLHGHAHNAPTCVNVEDYEFREPENAPADAVERFEEAYKTMLEGLKSASPNAEIRCMTLLPGRVTGRQDNTFCYSLRGADIDDYNDAIKRAAAQACASVVDIRAQGRDYDSIDGTHPSKEGMRQLASLIAAARGEAQAITNYPQSLRSKRTCNKTTCIGCPHTRSTGLQWTCVCEKEV